MLRALILAAVLALALAPLGAARALDIDLRLIGYSFIRAESAQVTPAGLEVRLADGGTRTFDLTYGYLLGTDGHLDHPRVLHVHWIRVTHAGEHANLVCTSTPLVLVAAFCLVLDTALLIRRFRRRSGRGSDRDAPSPSAGSR